MRQLAFWKDALDKPLADRVAPGGPELVDYLTIDNIANGYPQRPRSPAHDPGFLADVRGAITSMPPPVRKLLERKLLGVLLVEDIGGTGFTDEVVDAQGKAVAGFIVLDPIVLRAHTANSWITWRENTPFKPSARHQLAARIASGADDNRRQAIQYILLHEFAHVIAIGARLHPSWAVPPSEVKSPGDYPYFSLSWRISDGRYASVHDDRFTRRKDIVFYFGPKLDGADMRSIDEGLERTDFATLYSATHPGDDFAEAFANYLHVVMMRKPFAITIREDGRAVKTYRACWEQARCAAKRRLIEELLR
ncbi:MAG TPA: hypothetical protein VMN03_05510 [Burkholderiales bacterium]|nr:hypothetical protein [Burkholderiales bacterium]